ncbi:MAG: hypothetical protein BGO63_04725 [Candidatus Accumulibacter sp. 66-26]|nr:hypothetical protein [Accumulibacter sp.]MBN9424297.1 DUF2249 domain-containing protein [Accumulibacter sp.]OJW48432.1 MAG: hypothetical protein BGO63_04725 [Candidatus Accumulibacter sp. 66-26]
MHACNHSTPEALYPFDARGVAKRFRHAAIFGALDSLHPGETMRFCNDHDPLPLLAQLQARYGDAVEISYVQREPGAIVIDFARRG